MLRRDLIGNTASLGQIAHVDQRTTVGQRGADDVAARQFADLFFNTRGVAVSPGIGFGEYGEGYVRFALVENEQRIRQALRGLKQLSP